MATIRVPERATLDEVLAWRLSECESIRLVRRSGFELGVQGVALSQLAALAPRGHGPTVECEFEEPTDLADIEATLLGGAFGFALVRLVEKVAFAGRPASPELKPRLSALYRARQGVLGVGTATSLVCPDPVYSLPPALTATPGANLPGYFPPPSAFTAVLNRMLESLGFRRLLASAEEAGVVSFVYEALRNSLEHGLTADKTRRARSTRALIAEKVVLHGGDLGARRISHELKQYLERVAESNRGDLGLGVVCLTVSDQGDGIQATLPPKADLTDETPSQRLARAFLPGESRKPIGVVKRGLGLPSVISAAFNLQALIRVTSGNLVVGQDFSFKEDKYPKLNFDAIQVLPTELRCGTSISIFVPEFAFSLDQRSLFSR